MQFTVVNISDDTGPVTVTVRFGDGTETTSFVVDNSSNFFVTGKSYSISEL